MEKVEMTSLDIRFLIPELKEALQGSKIRKIYQYGTKAKHFMFEFWKPGKGDVKLYVDKDRIFLTEKREAVPQEPPSFCMFLRKHLMGKSVKDVRQKGFDRIIEMEIGEELLVFELFKPGNVILLDSMRSIIMPLEMQRWKDREIKPGLPYKYPPSPVNPFDIDVNRLAGMLSRSERTVGGFLASALGFGPLYGNEICKAAEVSPEMQAKDSGLKEATRIFEVMKHLGKMKAEGCLCEGMVTPFKLSDCEPKEVYPSFSSALDEFYTEIRGEEKAAEEKTVEEEHEQKVERIMKQQKAAEEKWTRIAGESRSHADLIYRNYSLVQGVLEGIRKAKDMGMEWKEIKEKIKAEDTPEAEAIKEIREHDGIVVVELEGTDVELDIRLSLEENAARYYEDSKWAKGKLGKLEESKEKVMKKIEAVREEPEEKEKPKKKRGRWFHKFRWFISSDGFLVVAGRNASQNDMLLTKYAEGGDWVYHADIKGAAFVVIVSKGKDVPEQTKKEAADFSAANSKAWSRGFGEMDVFCARRTQVSKPSGMARGSWVFSGEREWFRKLEVKLSIGVKVSEEEAEVVYGPVMAVRNSCEYFVTIIPGGRQPLDLARTIKNKILIKARPEHKEAIEKIELTDFEKAIPGGTGEVVEYS